jgi:hypothetical protein
MSSCIKKGDVFVRTAPPTVKPKEYSDHYSDLIWSDSIYFTKLELLSPQGAPVTNKTFTAIGDMMRE